MLHSLTVPIHQCRCLYRKHHSGGVTASVTYEIQKADPAAKNFVFTAPGSLTYDGTAKTADIKTATNITGMGDVMVKYYQGETEVQP